MSLKTLLMPAISQRLLSEQRLLKHRHQAEQKRARSGARHQLHYFHQLDDPYSALCAGALFDLVARYDIELLPHLVGPPPDSAAPERAKLVAYSRLDANRLAQHYALQTPRFSAQPSPAQLAQAGVVLCAALEDGRFAALAPLVSDWLWQTPQATSVLEYAPKASTEQLAQAILQGEALRAKLGHYLGAMFYYAGEWYWGIDRLHYLERRLQALGAQRGELNTVLYPPTADSTLPLQLTAPAPIDFYFSLRSPYSAIVMQRVFALGRLSGAEVRLRYVLPMVMRGLPVPANKRRYIATDTAREARLRGIPFGRLNDPVGRPTERGLALIPYAQAAGRAEAYLLSFMQGVWAEGIDAGSERGLRKIVERAGLAWSGAQTALQDQAWRTVAEANRTAMFALGLWGVPAFHVNDTVVWGQDRLWAVEDTLKRTQA